MRSLVSATSADLRRHSALLQVDSDGLAIDSNVLAPHSDPARGRFGGSQRARVPSRRTFNRSSPRFGPGCSAFRRSNRAFRAAPTRYNRSHPSFRTALVECTGPWNPFGRSQHPFLLYLPPLTDPRTSIAPHRDPQMRRESQAPAPPGVHGWAKHPFVKSRGPPPMALVPHRIPMASPAG